MKAVLFGTGWRAAFYLRIARMLPSLLSIVSVCTRSHERAELLGRDGWNMHTSPEEALSVPHDAVIVASGREGFHSLMSRLRERGERVLAETTFLQLSDEELEDLSTFEGAAAEQYRFTPLYASVIAALGEIGEADQVLISGLHNHHAAAIARIILGTGSRMPEIVRELDFSSSMPRTGSRAGLERGGEEAYVRKLRLLDFGGRLFIYDFSTNQYHSYLFGKRIEVRGRKGIITQEGLNAVGDDGYPYSVPFVFHRDCSTGNGSLTLSHVTLGPRTVFVNPFYPLPFSDDEIAIAEIIRRMDSGEEYPTIASAIMDARLGRLL